MSTGDLFAQDAPCIEIAADVYLLKQFILHDASALITEIEKVFQQAPPRKMLTPGGYSMSAAISNCGNYGWVTDKNGYRYSQQDPLTGKHWPMMPALFKRLASQAAALAGFTDFQPDACLINSYEPGSKMGLHQDKDELDFNQPIVSFSLGLPVTFQFGGKQRNSPKQNIELSHGDVIVWGRQKRLNYHGVLTLKVGEHPVIGARRINLTFRRAR
ncbi:DNA oxidative demethylase AlkB [Methylophaga sp. OBS3]|uniref:DNA oxidative demethylase AlkB n=1 Tax=Methylophaga sp. OBS3 TaxID=2991934 RepID=UPI00224E09E7|nr:DNA oxidative demethylase AlkB [Methylophaga sp. OBS3]MCX4189050.1 DNA oxidative demethylase AlkB [Methylophaga sp. OBS3]